MTRKGSENRIGSPGLFLSLQTLCYRLLAASGSFLLTQDLWAEAACTHIYLYPCNNLYTHRIRFHF